MKRCCGCLPRNCHAMGDETVLYLNQNDAAAIAATHSASLPGDLLPLLGGVVLARFHRNCLARQNDASVITVGIREGASVLCFAQIAFKKLPFFTLIGSRSLPRLALSVLRNPRFLFSYVRGFFEYRRRGADCPEITFIAVAPENQGRGLGTKLIIEASHIASAHGARELCTKTSNTTLAKFYQRNLNAKVVSTYSDNGLTYTVLKWALI